LAIISVRQRRLSDSSARLPQHDGGQVARLDLCHPEKAFCSVLVEIRFELCNVLRDPEYAVLVGHPLSLRVGCESPEGYNRSFRV
jgi:hypothetical protein